MSNVYLLKQSLSLLKRKFDQTFKRENIHNKNKHFLNYVQLIEKKVAAILV